MEEEAQAPGAVAVEEAPPGGDGASSAAAGAMATTVAAAATDDDEPAYDPVNPDEWLAWSERKIAADAAREEREAAQAVLTDPPAGQSSTTTASAEATADAPPSSSASEPPAPVLTPEQIAAAQAAGYKIEPPAPPPDPFASLVAKLAPFIGDSAYEQARAEALVVIEDTDPEWVEKDAKRTQAISRMRAIEQNRQIANDTYAWARQQIAHEDASALADLVGRQPGIDRAVLDGRQGLGPILKAAEAAAAASASAAKDAEWQAKYDARETYWKGEVARAKADKLVADTGEVARAPQAGAAPGARPGAAGPLYETIPGTNLPTEAAIQRMIRGDFANIDLS